MSEYIFEPSGYTGIEQLKEKLKKGVKSGQISLQPISSLFKDGWEQSLGVHRTSMPLAYLRAVLAFAQGTLTALVGECSEKPTGAFKMLCDSGKVEAYKDRLEFYDRFLLTGGERKWIELEEYVGPIEWHDEVQVDLSPADAIYKYVVLPLIYGEFPSATAWESVSLGREVSTLGVPDSIGGAALLNQSSLPPDSMKRALSHALQQYEESLRNANVVFQQASNVPTMPTNLDLANVANSISMMVADVTPDLYKGDASKKNWLPWIFGLSVVGAGAYYVMRGRGRDE